MNRTSPGCLRFIPLILVSLTALACSAVSGDIKTLTGKATGGDPEAQYKLGNAYSFGEGIRPDDAEAAKWYRRAAEQGHAAAQLNLGMAYTEGRGVPKDPAEAAMWYREAAEQGIRGAQIVLGIAYEAGTGVPQDYVEAMKWYRAAAQQGSARPHYLSLIHI